jgi:hypothetical protein
VRAGRPSAGFALPSAEIAGVAATAPASGLLALQAAGDDASRDDAARRRGTALVEELAALQRDMLAGALSTTRLARLSLLAEGEAGADPALREIVEAISLRARVQAALAGRG